MKIDKSINPKINNSKSLSVYNQFLETKITKIEMMNNKKNSSI